MKFGSWTFTGDQVSLSLFNNKNHVDLSDYWKSGTWDIIEVPAYLNVHNNTGIFVEAADCQLCFKVLGFRGRLIVEDVVPFTIRIEMSSKRVQEHL